MTQRPPYKKEIGWYEKRACLSQEFSSGVEFALLSKDWKQVCPFVTCRDFLQDAVAALVTKKKKSIYSFTYDPANAIPIHMDSLRLLVTNSNDSSFGDKIPACVEFVQKVEAKLGIARTRVRQCKNPPRKYARCGVFMFEASRRWLISPPMISLYTLLIRVGPSHTLGDDCMKTLEAVKDGQKNLACYADRSRISEAWAGIKKIMERGDRKVFPRKLEINYPNCEVGTMHNSMGIVGFSKEYAKSTVGAWYED